MTTLHIYAVVFFLLICSCHLGLHVRYSYKTIMNKIFDYFSIKKNIRFVIIRRVLHGLTYKYTNHCPQTSSL